MIIRSTTSPIGNIAIPVAHSGVDTEWGWDGMSITSYANGQKYFEQHFDNRRTYATLWHRYWNNTYHELSYLPQLSFSCGSGWNASLHMFGFIFHALGNFLGSSYYVDVADCALCPFYPTQLGLDTRTWAKDSVGVWYNYMLNNEYETKFGCRFDTTNTMQGGAFSGDWITVGNPGFGYYPNSIKVYPWALMLFKDWSDTDVNNYFNLSSTGASILNSNAKFGFKFYGQPIEDPYASANAWSWKNVDLPGLPALDGIPWHYKGRSGQHTVCGKATKNGHTYTIVKVSSSSQGYQILSLSDISKKAQGFLKVTCPCFNQWYIQDYIDVFEPGGHATPQPTGIYILESGCEYEVTYFS